MILIILTIVLQIQKICLKEILPSNCDCRDWYGACRKQGEEWTDEGTWVYRCTGTDSSDANFVGCQLPGDISTGKTLFKSLSVGRNESIDGFWAACEINAIRIKLELEPRCIIDVDNHKHVGEKFREESFQWLCLETGRWVTGCYFQNETGQWTLLKIGEIGYNGLVRHTCDRYKDNPGLVQYHAEIRDDIPFKTPPNKGENKNLPQFVDKRLKNTPIEWTHQNTAFFIPEDVEPNLKIRYLPQSRNINLPPK
uniref:Uncharacterized protein n=1 Tax=Meloidogyne incognita TaxID=6306 RepID=A0A914MFG0_MELIC